MRITHYLLVAMLFATATPLFSQTSLWSVLDESQLSSRSQERQLVPEKYRAYSLNIQELRVALDQVPLRFNPAGERKTLQIPMPDGRIEEFAIVEAPMMEPGLAAKFPQIKTYAGQGITDPRAAIYLDWTPQGFHAMIMRPGNTIYIDPFFKDDNSVYVSYDKADFFREEDSRHACEVHSEQEIKHVPSGGMAPVSWKNREAVSLKTYRIAAAAAGEYTAYHGGTVPLTLSAITTTLNRVRGIFETELSISFTLISNNANIIYTNAATDPYENPPTSNILAQNQTNLTNVIGASNYDFGHVFTTGNNGVATVGSVCVGISKGRGMTASSTPIGDPFNVDYVAHEIGHQFGAHHTFNGVDATNCTVANYHAETAYEPGSGSTLMSYAGICGTQSIQRRANDYFHQGSLKEIHDFVTLEAGSTCANVTATGNNTPTVNADFETIDGKYIPISTPFELRASGSDPDGDGITYAWEQYDLGPQGVPSSSSTTAPLFRSFTPTTSPIRSFPALSDILDNSMAASLSEKLPTVSRDMKFKVTARDKKSVGGGFSSDSITLHSVSTAGPFTVTSHNTSSRVNGNITVTWNVAGTTAAPINCAGVDIMVSTDGGSTYSNLLKNTPNDGSQVVTLPNIATSNARIKVKCTDNVFFDLNDADLRIAPSDAVCAERVSSGTLDDYSVWTEYFATTNSVFIIDQWNQFHNAIWSAYFGARFNETARLSQTINIPAGSHFAKLEFWYRLVRTDCGGDVFNVKVNGSVVKTYNLCNDAAANDWVKQVVELTPYIGTSPEIMFELVTNGIYHTDLFIDDISVYTCAQGAFAPLPVELLDFQARAAGNTAMLNWATASELNNHGFEVEMQLESLDFQQIGFVKGQGDATERNDYGYAVHDLAPGSYYFRLRQMDTNGEASYSPVRQVFIGGRTQVSVQPNPTKDVAHFALSLDADEKVKLEIMDGIGRVVGTVVNDQFSKGVFKIAYDVSDLPQGVYYYRLSGVKSAATGKFIIAE